MEAKYRKPVSDLQDLAGEEVKPEAPMARDLPTFNLRMPVELRQELEKERRISGRSLNAEIVARLRATLAPHDKRHSAREPSADYLVHSDTERAILAIFRRLDPEKQLALLSLFK